MMDARKRREAKLRRLRWQASEQKRILYRFRMFLKDVKRRPAGEIDFIDQSRWIPKMIRYNTDTTVDSTHR